MKLCRHWTSFILTSFVIPLLVVGLNEDPSAAGDDVDIEGEMPDLIQEETLTLRRRRRAIVEEEEQEKFVSYNEIQKFVDRFSMKEVESYSEILFDPTNFQVLIGARDYIFRLSLKGLQLLEAAEWGSKRNVIASCIQKGQSQYGCHNYVRVLQSSNEKLYVCGTNSFSPICTWRRLDNIGDIVSTEIGVGKVSFDPNYSTTSLMTADETMYVGTALDFLGRDSSFLRSRGDLDALRTQKSNLKWLSQPSFVATFESGGFVYFFFRENAVEAMNCGKAIYSRIGRICKNDPGGSIVLKDTWTTFLKSRLNCSIPGNYPFYYDNLQSVDYLPREQIFYGLFTTHDNSLAGSAVCAFTMNSVNASFEAPFKHQPYPSSAWGPTKVDNDGLFKCEDGRKSNKEDRGFLADKYQLMDEAVQPLTVDPLVVLDFDRATHIAVDVVSTRQSGSVHVAFVASQDGTIKKLSMISHSSFMSNSNRPPTTCLLEIIQPFKKNSSTNILSLKFLKETNSLYIGTKYEVIRIPMGRCGKHKTRHQCLATRDPYCGWDTTVLECTTAPGNNPLSSSWIQHVIGCPTNKEQIDGDWSSWSDWKSCIQSGTDDNCLCRNRKCDAPEPARGGANCSGTSTEVAKCTVHGGWTTWSAWSECSSSCGIAAKTRRRSCTNPKPQHGGRVCVGLDVNEIYCHNLPPCPKYANMPVDGAWSSWSLWRECSSSCGKGTRKRVRTCSQPNPQHGGKECPSCDHQIEECVGRKCSTTEAFSDWTPWLELQSTPYETIQRRFRVECSANMGRKGLINVKSDSPVHEDRRCSHHGVCSDPFGSLRKSGGWTSWTTWSQCDKPCGGGKQTRSRTCKGSCSGSDNEERHCNIFKCAGVLSCWSEWTTCSSSCGSGLQERNRLCVTVHNPLQTTDGCQGITNQHQPCQVQLCTGEGGWGSWSEWSTCDGKEEKVRTRRCLSHQPSKCRGLDLQKISCGLLAVNEISSFVEARTYSELVNSCTSMQAIIGSCVACLILGVALGALGVYSVCLRKRSHKIPSSPHYISAKPNHYVSVPNGDWKGGPSVTDSEPLNSPAISLKNGLKNSIRSAMMTTLPMKEFDTATIKRSSHGSYGNGHIRADLDSDRIFFS